MDVTDHEGAEEALQASEERFRTLLQFSFDVYWQTDAQHRFTRQEFSGDLADAPARGSEIGKTRWEAYLEPDEACNSACSRPADASFGTPDTSSCSWPKVS
jgi:PAS domain-containing protein